MKRMTADARIATYLAAPSLKGWQDIYCLCIPNTGRTMWQAWISFNLTHSLAAIMFGVGCIVVAAWFGVVVFPPWLLFLLAGISLLFALIGLRYWFGVPRAGTVLATLCLGAAATLYA